MSLLVKPNSRYEIRLKGRPAKTLDDANWYWEVSHDGKHYQGGSARSKPDAFKAAIHTLWYMTREEFA